MIPEDPLPPHDDDVGPVVEAFLTRFRKGERPALTDLIARHPALADELEEIIPALVELEQLGSATGSLSGPRQDDRGPSEGGHPQRLGDYRILRRIGGGGMGVVYEAEHESLKNRVALKVMHPRFRTDETYLRRFHIEARSAAGLHHTNIVSVFDYGEQDGVCFYAMQYIHGQPLNYILADLRRLRAVGADPISVVTPRGREARALPPSGGALRSVAHGLMTGRYADPSEGRASVATELIEVTAVNPERAADGSSGDELEPPSDPPSFASSSLAGSVEGRYYREIAKVCAQVADALEYAHRARVLHRDIKPPNLLLDALGNVWVTDSGLANLEGGEDISKSQDLVGTLRYMAPERFRGISDRSGDIYALGATLYELVTLRPAFEGADQLRLIERIVHEQPERPRLIDRHVPRDLETIVMKAMAKDPKDRFRSAGALAEELRQFAAGHPIKSRPVSFVERFWRWCKRDPWLAGANVAAAVLTTVLTFGSLWVSLFYKNQVERLKTTQGLADEATLEARRRAVDAYIAQADGGRFSHRSGQRFKSLEAVREASLLLDGLGNGPAEAKSREALRDLALAELALPDLQVARTIGKCPAKTHFVGIAPTFDRFVTSDDKGECAVYRVDTGAEVFHFPNTGPTQARAGLFDPLGRRLALLSGDRSFQLWRIDGPTPSLVVEERAGAAYGWTANFLDDGSALVYLTPDGHPVMIDTESGRKRVLKAGKGETYQLAFHPDGRRLVVVSRSSGQSVAEVRALDDPTPMASLPLPASASCVVWSPDGHRVAIACENHHIYLWDTKRREASPLVLSGLVQYGVTVAFNHRGDLLASNGLEAKLRLWDSRTGRQLLSVQTNALPRFSPDDRYLGIDRVGQSIRTFEVASGRELRRIPGDPNPDEFPRDLSFEPNGRVLAARLHRGVQLWDSEAVELLADLVDLDWSSPLFEEDGTLLTFGSPGLIRWPMRREGDRQELGPPRLLRNFSVHGANLASSRDGNVLLLACPGRSALLLAGESPGVLRSLDPQHDVRGGSVSPDGRWAATSSHNGPEAGIGIWDARTWRKVTALDSPNGSSVQFSPDGRWLATGSNKCKLWEVGTWRLVREIDVESGNIAFSPDGSMLAICVHHQVRLHDPATGHLLATFEAPNQGPAGSPTFSHDGSQLALTDIESREILIWDLRLIRAELADMGLDWGSANSARATVGLPPTAPPAPIHLEVRGSSRASLARLHAQPQWRNLLQRVPQIFPFGAVPVEEYHERSHRWAAMKRWPMALADAEQALKAQKDNAHFNALVGSLAYQSGNDPRAIAALSRALELEPDDPESVNTLAWLLANTTPSKRNPSRARELAERLVKADPRNEEFRTTLLLALMRLGADAPAISTIENAPNHTPFAELVVAVCYHRLGQTGRARQAQSSALKWRAATDTLTTREQTDFQALAGEVEATLAGPPGHALAPAP
jgi:eukaryotic-like serine/threonine-protein kinase